MYFFKRMYDCPAAELWPDVHFALLQERSRETEIILQFVVYKIKLPL